MSALIYTPEIIAWVQSHYNIDIPGPRIAEKLGVSYKSLNVKVHKLRKKGYHFAEKQYNKPAEIGEIRRQSHGKRIHLMMKTEAGFKYVPSPQTPKQITQKPQPMPRARSMRKAPEKPKEIKRTSLTDAEKLAIGYQWIWTNSKTKVLRHPSKINQP